MCSLLSLHCFVLRWRRRRSKCQTALFSGRAEKILFKVGERKEREKTCNQLDVRSDWVSFSGFWVL